MIYTTNPIYGKVWKIMRTEQKYMDVRMTTSAKDSNGEWIDSTWFPRLMGHAFNSLKGNLKDGDKIVITKAILENPPYEAADGSKKSSFKFRILEASISNGEQGGNAEQAVTSAQTTQEPEVPNAKDECPW